MKKISYIICMFAMLVATTSCEDFLNITPDGQSKRDEQLSTSEGIEEAMYGVYSQLRSQTLYGQELYFSTLEMLSHTMWCQSSDKSTEALSMYDWENSSVKSVFESIWTSMYKNISNVNSVLDAPLVKEAKNYPYTIYRGEALGLRAFMHFDLVRLFAEQYTQNKGAEGIPYATEFSLKTPEFESLEDNYRHIIADLLEAESLLVNEDEYEGLGNYMLDRQIHFNKYAVWGTLARVYLTMGQNEKAYEYAQKAVGGKYTLKEKTEIVNDLAGVLSRKECLWGIYSRDFYNSVNTMLQQTISFTSLDLRDDFKEKYEAGDYRWSAYFSEVRQGSSEVKYRLSKFTDMYEKNDIVASRPADLIQGINMIRIPEMYYIISEALLNRKTKNDSVQALGYYNAVRERRGLPQLEDAENFNINLISEERFKEMIGEGQTYFNMKRLNSDIKSYDGKANYKASKEIYVVPIPDIEKEYRF